MIRLSALVAVALTGALPRAAAARTDIGPLLSASDSIRRAIAERIGRADAAITVLSIDLPDDAPVLFRDALPDPGARLGRAMRFVLRPASGRPVVAVVTAAVVIDQAVLRRDIGRGASIAAEDLTSTRGAISGVPLRRFPAAADLAGSRARRSLSAGDTVLPAHVVLRRAVEPGDAVTVVARSGPVEVTALLIAADGGDPGDVVRVVNRETRRDLRARVIERGRVEVEHAH